MHHSSTNSNTPPASLTRDDLFGLSLMWAAQNERAAHRPLELLRLFFEHLCVLTGSHTAFAVLAKKDPKAASNKLDPLGGWRAVELITYHNHKATRQIREQWMASFARYSSDTPTIKIVAGAGQHRAHTLTEALADQPNGEHTGAALLEQLELEDRLVGAHALDRECELYIGVDRVLGSEKFNVRERDLLLEAIRGMRALAVRVFMSFGLLTGQTPLTRREREALHLLLDGSSEKQVAAKMGITTASAHQYAVSIYRKLGVSSRPQLLNMWLDPLTR